VTRSSGGYVAIYAIGAAAVLVLLGDEGLDVARLHRESRAAVDAIETLLALGSTLRSQGKGNGYAVCQPAFSWRELFACC
jgi:hypothetical protein